MQDNERLELILTELREHKVVNVTQLAAKCFVSPCTLRRDLKTLEKRGELFRAYGKAILAGYTNEEIPYAVRIGECEAEKEIIGSLAAELVQDGDCLLLDPSSTVSHLIPHLSGKRRLNIVTNGAQTAVDCQRALHDASIFCTGGVMNPNMFAFSGSAAQAQLESFRPDIAFFSARGISIRDGVGDVNEDSLQLRRVMLRVSRKCVYLCDSRKFGRPFNRVACALSEIDCLITDRRPTPEWERALDAAGVELIYPGA